MTDNEIIKALECCVKEEYHCNDCPYESDKHFNKKTITFETMPNGMSYDQLSCDEWLKKDALDLINRQKAEIARLQDLNNAEAIKEFADNVHTEIHQALESNYKARAERMAKPNIDMADEFISYCEGKIAALRGIDDFVNETYKEMVGAE